MLVCVWGMGQHFSLPHALAQSQEPSKEDNRIRSEDPTNGCKAYILEPCKSRYQTSSWTLNVPLQKGYTQIQSVRLYILMFLNMGGLRTLNS